MVRARLDPQEIDLVTALVTVDDILPLRRLCQSHGFLMEPRIKCESFAIRQGVSKPRFINPKTTGKVKAKGSMPKSQVWKSHAKAFNLQTLMQALKSATKVVRITPRLGGIENRYPSGRRGLSFGTTDGVVFMASKYADSVK